MHNVYIIPNAVKRASF